MEVVLPTHDFHFSSTTTTPYASAPSSPSRFGFYHYASAPTSPTHAAAIYTHFTTTDTTTTNDDDFAFNFSGPLHPEPTTADQLFHKGRIRPLKPPPRLSSSPVSPNTKGSRSPRQKQGCNFDPFTAAMVEVTKDRGRQRIIPLAYHSASRSRKGSRSLSPLRGEAPVISSITKTSWIKKWKLRDLFLFRSASEGRATGKDPMRKYTMLSTSSASNKEDVTNASFRSIDSHGSMRRGGGAAVSAHEMLYTANRAELEELKKKTPLPYRQGLLGCLRFNPVVNNIKCGFHSYSFNRKS